MLVFTLHSTEPYCCPFKTCLYNSCWCLGKGEQHIPWFSGTVHTLLLIPPRLCYQSWNFSRVNDHLNTSVYRDCEPSTHLWWGC